MVNIAKWFVLFGVVSITSAPLDITLARDNRQASSYIKVDVKKKPADAEWRQRDTRTIDTLPRFTPYESTVELDQYGGRTDRQAEATGFFHPRKIDGRCRAYTPAVTRQVLTSSPIWPVIRPGMRRLTAWLAGSGSSR